jgi:RecA/RadA recombinase
MANATTKMKEMLTTPTPQSTRTFLTTGCDMLDILFGGGVGLGIETGDIVNMPGPSSSGKTAFAIGMIAANLYQYKDKFKWVYDDCESGCTFNTRDMYGFDLIPTNERDIVKSRTVEEMSCNFRKFTRALKNDEYGIYVVDSLDGLANHELLERAEKRQIAFEKGKDFDEGSYMMATASFLSKEFFRTLVAELHEKKIVLLILSQLRSNIGAGLYAPKKIRAGGDALDFYCHSISWLKVLEKIEVQDRMIGSVIECDLRKSKTPRPNRSCMFTFYTSMGIDNVGTSLDFLYDLRSAKTGELLKAAKSINWDGVEYEREALISYIEDNDLEEELRRRVVERWEGIEKSILVQRKRRYG